MRDFVAFQQRLQQKITDLQQQLPCVTRAMLEASPEGVAGQRVIDLTETGKLTYLSSIADSYHLNRSFLEMRFDPESDRADWIKTGQVFILASDGYATALCAAERLRQMGYQNVYYLQEAADQAPVSIEQPALSSSASESQNGVTLVDLLAMAHLQVTPLNLSDLSDQPLANRQFIDLRTQAEIAETGMIPGAWHFPRTNLEDSLLALTAEQGKQFEQDVEYVLYCATDTRSMLAYPLFAEMGMPNIRPLRGGFQKWCGAGYPITDLRE